ncbi:MAG: isomerase [Arcobacter sp.]|nr:MAG: isomerase [Arcobacter sp.]
MKVYQYDAFAMQANMGNPAGIVLQANNLSDEAMQKIAHLLGFNETAFILHSSVADIKIRYFTPGHEMNLCGHGTVASLIALNHQSGRSDIKTIETKAGIIEARINKSSTLVTVIMKQLPAKFDFFIGDESKLAAVLGLDENDIEKKWPIVYGSTGIWTLLVPIKKLSTFKKMSPQTKNFPQVLKQLSHCSIHPFCLETIHQKAQMHARHFSSPYSGTIEDPVTGTASGVMGAYYLKYIKDTDYISILVEQGQEMGKDGCIAVIANKNKDIINVSIEGRGIFVKEINLNYQV